MNRPTMSLLAAAGSLVALAGLASATGGDGQERNESLAGSEPSPVVRTELVCPRATTAESARTDYTAFTPVPASPAERGGEREPGSAQLLPVPEHVPDPGTGDDGSDDGDDGDGNGNGNGNSGEENGSEQDAEPDAEPVVPLEEPGAPATATTRDADAPALTGIADGALAPGWTVQQSTLTNAALGGDLLGTACQRPGTEFWFPGASTAESRQDYVHLTNPDDASTVVDIELYGPEGRIEAEAGMGITLPAASSVPVRLSTLTDEETDTLAVHVTARTGRIGAQIEASDDDLGADWLPPAATHGSGALVLPGIPADAESVQLTAFTSGDEDVTLNVGLAGPSGTIVPAGNETLTVPSGAAVTADLGALTQGEAGSLVLTPAEGSGSGMVAAALLVTRGPSDGPSDMAFIPATAPLTGRASAAGNTADGTGLTLTAPHEAAEVEITFSAGVDGGEPVTERYTVEAGTSLAVTPDLPGSTEGRYGLTIRSLEGTPVYAARALTSGEDAEDDPAFTVQTLPDDQSAVTVPPTGQDLSILTG